MARGGKREGAGRKKGSLTRRTAEIARQSLESGLTPLEVMLRAMRARADERDWDKAADIASKAAPYIHPRLASVEHKGDPDAPIKHDHEIVISFVRAK